MQKIIKLFFVISILIYGTWSVCLASAFNEPTAAEVRGSPSLGQENISKRIRESGGGQLSGTNSITYETVEKDTQDQDFYKATVQAYRDFNEQTIKYLGIVLAIVSVLATILVSLFFFMFRKTLTEIKNDLSRDADRLQGIYSRTFDLLNEQARTNLEIFRSRESELKTKIEEGRDLYEKIKKAMEEIAENQKVRDPVAEKLAEEEVANVEVKRKEIKEEVEDYKKDLGPFTE